MRPSSAINLLAILVTAIAGGCAHETKDPTIATPQLALVTLGGGEAPSREGFLITPDGIVVTASSGIPHDMPIPVKLRSGATRLATFIEEDREAGVAVLKIPGDHYNSLHLTIEDIAPIMPVRLVRPDSIAHGLFLHWENAGQSISFDIAATPADAGAPLLANDGSVIGVVVNPQNASGPFATPVWRIVRILPGETK